MRYRIFGRHTGLRVAELVLGTGAFGTRWGHGAPPDEARRILDAYAAAGGNFIDTADTYQFGESEELLGRFLSGRRDERLNVHGGACALGHPIGATGARLIVTLLHALQRHGLARVAALCIGGGETTAIAIERCD